MSINWCVDNRKEKEISTDITTQKFKMTSWIHDDFKRDKISFIIQTPPHLLLLGKGDQAGKNRKKYFGSIYSLTLAFFLPTSNSLPFLQCKIQTLKIPQPPQREDSKFH